MFLKIKNYIAVLFLSVSDIPPLIEGAHPYPSAPGNIFNFIYLFSHPLSYFPKLYLRKVAQWSSGHFYNVRSWHVVAYLTECLTCSYNCRCSTA